MRILVVEDDLKTASFVTKGLREAGYVVDHAEDGTQALERALSEAYDVLVIDRMLPGLNGIKVVETIRSEGVDSPVLFLSALGDVEDRVQGLKAGGDDYLVKPFALSELLARLEALMRRGRGQGEVTQLSVGDLEMDILARKVIRQGQRVYLHPREFKLLEYLMRHAGQVVTRTMLLENVWEYHFDPQTNVIDVHISRLRQKVDKPFDKTILHTVRGAGYKLELSS
ncbi:MAG: response regulator transcription factor [Rhodospirillaceae bacterium]|nr:response regulator transcription factor [Rhodospirillaceae bacterium]